MTMQTEPIDKWVRAYVDDVVVVDTREPVLFWEEVFPVPHYAFKPGDVRTDLLSDANGEPPSASFFTPKGPVSKWYDLTVGGRTIPNAAWVRDDPAIGDRIVLSWEPGVLDRWLEEDEEVTGHPRDPHKRVEVIKSSRHVVVERNGVLLADSRRPALLFETSLPTRYYLPREDVDFSVLESTVNRSHCPYKGYAEEYWSVPGDPEGSNIAWSYSAPLPAVGKIEGRVAFYNEIVDITVDGVLQERPESPFSTKGNRPNEE